MHDGTGPGSLVPEPGICYIGGSVDLVWTAHPARRRPRDLALVAAVLFLTTGAVLVSFESLFMTGLAAVILVLSVASFLFPTRYRLSDEGIEERRMGVSRARRWAELRRLEIGPGAALVSPFARKSWLDRTRGFLLLFDGADRQAVVDELRRRMGPAGSSPSISPRVGEGTVRGGGQPDGT